MRSVLVIGLVAAALTAATGRAVGEEERINTVPEIFQRLGKCFKSPKLPPNHPGLQITFLVNFNRAGEMFGKPKIIYESEYASDDDRLLYRTAVMEAIQRCTPMPFTSELGNAVAGRPLRLRLDDRRTKSI